MATNADTVSDAERQSFGRPWYRRELDAEAHRLALLGMTDEEIAENLEIDISTFYRWKAKKRSFREALIRAGARADAEVADRLRQRAMGYSHQAVKIFPPREPGGEPVIVPYVEHYPPDTAAASLWLRNRQGGKWREKTDVVHSGTIGLEAWVAESMPKLEQARVIEHQAAQEGSGRPIGTAGDPDSGSDGE